MPPAIRKTLTVIGLTMAGYVLISMVITLSQLATLVDRFVPNSGNYVFAVLLLAFAGIVAYPVHAILRLPISMVPPDEGDGPKYEAYQAWLLQHLKDHPDSEVAIVAHREGTIAALARLEVKANKLVCISASQVFVETALIQNGRMDALIVLLRQVKLVWSVAKIYGLRPTPQHLWYLYSNVGAASLLSMSLDDIDLKEMTQPIVVTALPSVASAIPGMQAITSVIVNSIADGAANALLTLRIGMLTKRYALPMYSPETVGARRSASLEALGMLAAVTKESGSKVANAVFGSAKVVLTSVAGKAWDGAKGAANSTVEGLSTAAAATGEALANAGVKSKVFVQESAQVVSDVGRKAIDQTAKVGTAASESIGIAVNATGEALANAGAKSKDLAQYSVQAVSDVGRKAMDQTAKVGAAASESIGNAVNATGDALASVGAKSKFLAQESAQVVSGVGRKAIDQTAKVGAAASESVGAAMGAAGKHLAGLKERTAGVVANVGSYVSQARPSKPD